jgi:glycosyltransferase involved in cell wall biosynthesis
MRKKLLFVIPGLDAGGAEKSLVNLLNTLDETRFSVDLFLFSHQGLFLSQVPEFVTILPKNEDLIIFQKSLLSSMGSFLLRGKILSAVRRLRFFLMNRNVKNAAVAEQSSWKFIADSIQPMQKEYDAAIGFLEKSSIYFVTDKVNAKRKIGFIHNDYNKLGLNKAFDKPYFDALDRIATVSDECIAVLKEEFPENSQKVQLIHNIVSSRLIRSLADQEAEKLKNNAVVSVGRLHPQKGFDLAIEAATILKNKNVDFHWYIIGEGGERKDLEGLITKNNLQYHITLLGLKKNPYPYIKQAKVFVQPSRYEGKSIAIDEAKILCKPIILTNFTTAKDQIDHNVNGIICEMTPQAVADSVLKYMEDQSFTDLIIANLQKGNFGTEEEIKKFYQIIE